MEKNKFAHFYDQKHVELFSSIDLKMTKQYVILSNMYKLYKLFTTLTSRATHIPYWLNKVLVF